MKFHTKEPLTDSDFNDSYVNLFSDRYPQAIPLKEDPDCAEIQGVYKNPGYDPIEIFSEGKDMILKHRGIKKHSDSLLRRSLQGHRLQRRYSDIRSASDISQKCPWGRLRFGTSFGASHSDIIFTK